MFLWHADFDAQKESLDDEALSNPAHALIGSLAQDQDLAEAFVEWLSQIDGGQEVIKGFAVNGTILYSPVSRGSMSSTEIKPSSRL